MPWRWKPDLSQQQWHEWRWFVAVAARLFKKPNTSNVNCTIQKTEETLHMTGHGDDYGENVAPDHSERHGSLHRQCNLWKIWILTMPKKINKQTNTRDCKKICSMYVYTLYLAAFLWRADGARYKPHVPLYILLIYNNTVGLLFKTTCGTLKVVQYGRWS